MAGTSSLGRLTLDLVVKAGAFTAGMTAAERQANKSLSAIEKRAYKFGQTLGQGLKIGAVAAVAALGALSLAVGKAIDNADEIRDLSIRLGTSTETLSAFGYAASQTGTDLDTLGRGMKILAKNAADALKPTSEQAQIFDALGISVTDVTGKLKDQSVLIPEIATAFKGMEDGTTKTALALALFGKSGTDMIEFLNQGADGLADFEDKARSLGVVIDSETAAAADEFNDILGDLKAIVSGGALTIAKELLPALKEGATDLKRLANEGELASNIASILNAVVKAGVGTFDVYNLAVARASIQLEGFMGVMEGAKEVQSNFGSFGLSDGSVMEGMKKITDAATKENKALQELEARFRNRDRFAGVTATVDSTATESSNVDRGKLNNALAGIGSGSKKSGGKSDAEKEADKLKAAYDRMNESLTEQIGTFGLVGEAAKLRYELEHGELSKLTDAEKESLIVKAEKLDAMNQEKELQDAADKFAKEQVKAITDGIKATDEFIDQLKFELELMGMTNLEMEKAIALRHLDANATDEQRKAIADLIAAQKNATDAAEGMDVLRGSTRGLFEDLMSGAKSGKEAFGDFVDSVLQGISRIVAKRLTEQLLGSDGSTGGGAVGGWFSAFMGMIGGGRAAGGGVKPWSIHPVNELGMEGLTVNGKDYLMTGSQSGVVTPNHKLGSSRSTQVTQIFPNAVLADKNSDAQRQQEAARKLRNATRFA